MVEIFNSFVKPVLPNALYFSTS